MGNHKQLQDQRRRLASRQKWKCFFCGQKMLPAGTRISGTKKTDPRSLTFDHWDSRLDAERGKHVGEFRNVASCWKCNNERNAERQRQVPKEELWKRSGAYPLEIENELDSAGPVTRDDPAQLRLADDMAVSSPLSLHND